MNAELRRSPCDLRFPRSLRIMDIFSWRYTPRWGLLFGPEPSIMVFFSKTCDPKQYHSHFDILPPKSRSFHVFTLQSTSGRDRNNLTHINITKIEKTSDLPTARSIVNLLHANNIRPERRMSPDRGTWIPTRTFPQ